MTDDSKCLKAFLFEFIGSFGYIFLVSTWNDDRASFLGKFQSNSFANACGWSSDESDFSFHLWIN